MNFTSAIIKGDLMGVVITFILHNLAPFTQYFYKKEFNMYTESRCLSLSVSVNTVKLSEMATVHKECL